MVQRKKRLISNFPIYNLQDEDITNVLICQSDQTVSFRANLLLELNPDTITFIVSGLSSWFNYSVRNLDRQYLLNWEVRRLNNFDGGEDMDLQTDNTDILLTEDTFTMS